MNGRLRVGLVCPYSFDIRGGVQSHVVGLARFLTAAGHEVRVLAPGKAGPDAGLHPEQFTSAGAAIPVPYNGSVARVNFGPTSRTRARRWLRLRELRRHPPPRADHAQHRAARSLGRPRSRRGHVPRLNTAITDHGARRAGLRTVIAKVPSGLRSPSRPGESSGSICAGTRKVIPNGFTSLISRTIRRGSACGKLAGRRPPRLSFLGRTNEPRKGLSVLLDALPLIRACHPDLDVAVAGTGNGRLPDGCRRLGALSDEAKADLLERHRCLRRPPAGTRELRDRAAGGDGFSAGVVASDLEPFLDLLQPGGAAPLGELFPRGDSTALADAALRVLAAPNEGRTARAAWRAGAMTGLWLARRS